MLCLGWDMVLWCLGFWDAHWLGEQGKALLSRSTNPLQWLKHPVQRDVGVPLPSLCVPSAICNSDIFTFGLKEEVKGPLAPSTRSSVCRHHREVVGTLNSFSQEMLSPFELGCARHCGQVLTALGSIPYIRAGSGLKGGRLRPAGF